MSPHHDSALDSAVAYDSFVCGAALTTAIDNLIAVGLAAHIADASSSTPHKAHPLRSARCFSTPPTEHAGPRTGIS